MLTWQKSSLSGRGSNDCIETARVARRGVLVRDSKDPASARLGTFDRRAWAAFVTAVRTGDLDR